MLEKHCESLTKMELVTLECPLEGDCLDKSGDSF